METKGSWKSKMDILAKEKEEAVKCGFKNE